jgi:hypothetical protein
MALSVFPIDGILPTLIAVTEKDRMINIFNNTLPEVLSGSLEIKDLRFEIAHYGRFRRCVLRFIMDGGSDQDGRTQQQVVYGKVDADNYGALAIPIMAALLERMRDGLNSFHFRIPRTLGYLPDLRLLLLEALPGNVRMKDLLMDCLCGTETVDPESLSLEEAIEDCARMISVLHRSQIKLGRRRNFEDEISELGSEIQVMEQVFPASASDQTCRRSRFLARQRSPCRCASAMEILRILN